ncbi:hypothetical protein JTE90_006872 [Oedothorax gibbosus]|uniref:Uncharacterized protein n=1 Tax=Oedothorax gibbosus TaxID=931172 RepID=A0AAV6TI55_9ARAC|nr:hypothetical protein JTE90_006872 [Oedothorax gibbosus]
MCELECTKSNSSFFEKEFETSPGWREQCEQVLDGSVEAEQLQLWRMTPEELKEECKCFVSCKKDCWTYSYDFSVTEREDFQIFRRDRFSVMEVSRNAFFRIHFDSI